MMDDETGEINYTLQIQTNDETGEDEYMMYYVNEETGEREYYSVEKICDSLQMPNPFKISRYTTNLSTIVKLENSKFKTSEKHNDFITAIVFLIPTFIIFTPILGFFILTFDVLLHRWCHQQNSKLKLKGIYDKYYHSPLHTIYKEFCAKCIDEEGCRKINKIQDIRYNRKRIMVGESLRGVVA